MGASFRIATRRDLDLLGTLMREFYTLERLAFDEELARAALEKILDDSSLGRVWLIHVEGTPAGYFVLTFGFSLEFQGRDAFLDEIYVRSEHQGRGVGRGALTFVEEECRSLGMRALHLEVDRGNIKAQSVYRNSGFEDRGNHLLTKRLSHF